MRLNLGSGAYPLEGYTNVDAFTEADIQGDIMALDFEDIEEVNLSHVLEHISWRQTVQVLEHIRGWMVPGGRISAEVPDMERILRRGTIHPLWFKYVFGDQSHEGEYHRAGFTATMLWQALYRAGWQVSPTVTAFESTHKGREGMPCLKVTARA